MLEYLYHYTTIDTFALILKTKKIRFNRLDHVDDLSECESMDGKHAGRTIFVSCWTNDEKENIPLWKMYAGLDGVRIKLPVKWYKEYKLDGTRGKTERFFHEKLHMDITLPYSGPIKPIELINNKFAIMPNFSSSVFPLKVEYTNDDSKLLPRTIFKNGGEVTVGLEEIGKYKSTYWEFQKEYRYMLHIMPIRSPETYGASIHDVFPTDLNLSEYPISEYFIDISETALSNMEVVLGPKCTESKRLILSALLEKYAPNSSLGTSVLSGKIK